MKKFSVVLFLVSSLLLVACDTNVDVVAPESTYEESEEVNGDIVIPDGVSEAYEWALAEIENMRYLSSPWSIRQRMINLGGFSEETADEVLILLADFDWTDRAFASLEDLIIHGNGFSRNGLLSELELGGHTDETISTAMQKIDDMNVDWYEQAMNFINWHGPTSGFMNHENRFRDWMIEVGFTESEAQYAYNNFRANLE